MTPWARFGLGVTLGLCIELRRLAAWCRKNEYRLPFDEETRVGYFVTVASTILSSGIAAAGVGATLDSPWLVGGAALVVGQPLNMALHLTVTVEGEDLATHGDAEADT